MYTMRNYFFVGIVIFLLTASIGYFVHDSIVGSLGREYVYDLSWRDDRIAQLERQAATDSPVVSLGVKPDVIVPQDLNNGIDPVVVFNPGGKFSDAEKEMITKRLINPLVDYYRMHSDVPKVYGIMVTIHDNKQQYLYGVDVLLRGDGKNYLKNGYFGFLYGTPGTEIEYWQPECMGKCELNKAYMAKYPYIK